MDKASIIKAANQIRFAAKKHQPEILTGIGIAGMITTTVMAVKATPRALDLLAEVKEAHQGDPDKKEVAKDIITKVCPVYIPATLIGCISIGCLIGASSVNFKRNAALATAYTLSESALKEYQEKVVETIGEKKERTVRDAVAKDQIEKHPVESREIFITEKGNTLCLDPLSGRFFESDIDKLKKAMNELNRRMRDEMYISLNEFYYEIGLPGTETGEILGWNIDRGYIDLDFTAGMSPDNRPCIVVGHNERPQYRYA